MTGIWFAKVVLFNTQFQYIFSRYQTMGKRYCCEYCDRHFADSPGNRKKHINGIQHKRNRKMHYDSFKGSIRLAGIDLMSEFC